MAQKIQFYIGDTYEANISIDGYVPSNLDTITFGIKENYHNSPILFETEIDPEKLYLYIPSEATLNFPKNGSTKGVHGEYVFNARIKFNDEAGTEHIKTFLQGSLKLLCEVLADE